MRQKKETIMPSIFTRIINGEIPCYKIAEDDHHLAFLDIRPVALGHTLVVPKTEVDYIFDLPDDKLAALHLFSKRVARALEKEVKCVRIGTMVLGLEVPHAHIHLVPLDSRGIIDITARLDPPREQMQALAERVFFTFQNSTNGH